MPRTATPARAENSQFCKHGVRVQWRCYGLLLHTRQSYYPGVFHLKTAYQLPNHMQNILRVCIH